MNKGPRQKLFYLFAVLFLLLAPALVVYAYGWRLDLKTFRPVKIGGVFLRNLPSDALIKIDNKSAERQARQTLTGTLINNLLPGEYQIEVNKEGYLPWRKTVAVAPAAVTESLPIILIPEKPSETSLLKRPLLDFWVSDSKLIYQDLNGGYYLMDTGEAGSRINLSLLFDSLKQRLLKFPGHVPIAGVARGDNPNRWIISTEKSSYLIDTQKLSLELLPEKSIPTENSPHEIQLDREKWGLKKYVYDNGRLYLLRAAGLTYAEL